MKLVLYFVHLSSELHSGAEYFNVCSHTFIMGKLLSLTKSYNKNGQCLDTIGNVYLSRDCSMVVSMIYIGKQLLTRIC